MNRSGVCHGTENAKPGELGYAPIAPRSGSPRSPEFGADQPEILNATLEFGPDWKISRFLEGLQLLEFGQLMAARPLIARFDSEADRIGITWFHPRLVWVCGFTSCPKPVARDSGRLARRAINAAGGVLHHLYFRRPRGIQRKERPRRFTAGLENPFRRIFDSRN